MTQSKLFIVSAELLIWAPSHEEEMDRVIRALEASRPSMPARILVVFPGTEIVDLRTYTATA